MNTSDDVQDIVEKLETVKIYLINEGLLEQYDGISKSINILKSQDKKAYCKINKHLQDDFRMLYDNGHGNRQVDIALDSACTLSEKFLRN